MKLMYRGCPNCSTYNKTNGMGVREYPEGGPRVAKCSVCNLIYLNPIRDDNDELRDSDSQRLFVKSIVNEDYFKKIEKQTKYRIKSLKKNIRRAVRVLDVGAGISNFACAVKDLRNVVDAVGLEPSRSRAIEAQQLGLGVVHGDITHDFVKHYQPNCITLFQVLEHIEDPIGFLSSVHDILMSDGLLIVEVPNHDDFLVRLKAYKKFYYQNAHCTYFNTDTLKRIAKKCGFDIYKEVRIQRYSLDNHLNWLFRRKPGAIGFVRPLNIAYSNVLKFFGVHDTVLMIFKRRTNV